LSERVNDLGSANNSRFLPFLDDVLFDEGVILICSTPFTREFPANPLTPGDIFFQRVLSVRVTWAVFGLVKIKLPARQDSAGRVVL
jgi:hypothetical protein